MENGEIIEQGNHRELVAKNGKYTQLHQTQFVNS
jgi:ABC-type multidrug transport system fused ATPase/permease subunit